jgi:hypothetical protein
MNHSYTWARERCSTCRESVCIPTGCDWIKSSIRCMDTHVHSVVRSHINWEHLCKFVYLDVSHTHTQTQTYRTRSRVRTRTHTCINAHTHILHWTLPWHFVWMFLSVYAWCCVYIRMYVLWICIIRMAFHTAGQMFAHLCLHTKSKRLSIYQGMSDTHKITHIERTCSCARAPTPANTHTYTRIVFDMTISVLNSFEYTCLCIV